MPVISSNKRNGITSAFVGALAKTGNEIVIALEIAQEDIFKLLLSVEMNKD